METLHKSFILYFKRIIKDVYQSYWNLNWSTDFIDYKKHFYVLVYIFLERKPSFDDFLFIYSWLLIHLDWTSQDSIIRIWEQRKSCFEYIMVKMDKQSITSTVSSSIRYRQGQISVHLSIINISYHYNIFVPRLCPSISWYCRGIRVPHSPGKAFHQ